MTLNQSFSNRPITLAVLGSSGAVGLEILKLLEERSFPVKELRLLASERSAGKIQSWKGQDLVIQSVAEDKFENVGAVLSNINVFPLVTVFTFTPSLLA